MPPEHGLLEGSDLSRVSHHRELHPGVHVPGAELPGDRHATVEDIAASFLRGEFSAEYPHLTEHALQHMEPGHDDVSAYELGLDLILDGLEKLRDTA